MKILKQLSIIFIALLSFNSCDEIDKLTEFDFDTTLVEEITFTVDSSDGAINETVVINLEDNSDIKKYLDKIEDINIDSAKYTVVAFNGDASANGTIC